MSKVAVIGAGIIGVCTAHFLRKNGHQVTLYDQNEPGTQTSFGNAGLFANHECVTANSPHLWKNLPSMLLNKNGPLVIDWFYVFTHLPWAIRFLRNCTSARAEHIAKSLSAFSCQAGLAYEEIFDDVDVLNNIVHKEPIFLYESKKLFEQNQYAFNLRKKYDVQFVVINKEEIAKIEPGLEPIYYNGVVLKGESFTNSPLEITQKIFNNFIKNDGHFIKIKIKSINPEEYPSIQFNYLSTKQDRKEWCEAIHCSRKIIETNAMSEFMGREIAPGDDVKTDEKILDFIAREGESAYHLSGTCKMGSDEMSVVDSKLKVHGIDNLWVVDASIMPTVTNGNIYSPVLMIGEKAADTILGNTPLKSEILEFYKHN